MTGNARRPRAEVRVRDIRLRSLRGALLHPPPAARAGGDAAGVRALHRTAEPDGRASAQPDNNILATYSECELCVFLHILSKNK